MDNFSNVTISALATAFIPVLYKIFANLFSSIGMLEIEKIFAPKTQVFFAKILKSFSYLLLLTYFFGYFSFLLYSAKPVYNFIASYWSLIMLILLILFLINFFVCFLTTSQKFRQRLKRSPKFKAFYPVFNISINYCTIFFLVLCVSTYFIFLIDNNKLNEKLIALIVLFILVYTCALIIKSLLEFLSSKYLKQYCKITKLITKDGRFFNNLYLYAHNDKCFFFGKEPEHTDTERYIILYKDTVVYYEVIYERYFWDEKVR